MSLAEGKPHPGYVPEHHGYLTCLYITFVEKKSNTLGKLWICYTFKFLHQKAIFFL